MSTGRTPEHIGPDAVAAQLAGSARNREPLHTHAETDPPWTAETLAPHLQVEHGLGGLQDGETLASLEAIHALTRHGQLPLHQRLAAAREAAPPERRYKSITLGKARNGYPGDLGLVFEYEDGNGTNIVNLRPADVMTLRAAVIPLAPGLKSLQDLWSGNVGPGGRHAVEAGHAAGYRLGIEDMEWAFQAVPQAERAAELLEQMLSSVLDEPGTAAADRQALTRVIGFLQQRIDAEQDTSRG